MTLRILLGGIKTLSSSRPKKLRTPFVFEIYLTTKEKIAWYKRQAKELIPVEQFIQEFIRGATKD